MLVIIKMKLDTDCVLTLLTVMVITLISIHIILKMDNFIDASDVEKGKASHANSDEKKDKENDSSDHSQQNKLKGCKPSDTMEQICINHMTCCSGAKRENHACYCDHPITQSCVEGYNKCKQHLEKSTSYMKWIGKEEIEKMCSASLGLCCGKFAGIDTSKVKFAKKDTDKAIIKLNPFCALGAKKDVEKNCEKMCATYKPCKGFTADRLGCTLFDTIDLFDPSTVKVGPRGVAPRGPDPNKSIAVGDKSYNPNTIMMKLNDE